MSLTEYQESKAGKVLDCFVEVRIFFAEVRTDLFAEVRIFFQMCGYCLDYFVEVRTFWIFLPRLLGSEYSSVRRFEQTSNRYDVATSA